jgi:16S rRNA (cytosine967-C5)-methyltransferase
VTSSPANFATSATLCESYAGASQVIAAVLDGASLTDALERHLREMPQGANRSAIHDLSYQTLRDFGWVHFIVSALVERAPSPAVVTALLYVALSDLKREERSYVVVDQAVRAVRLLGCHNAAGFINGVLRNYVRRAGALTEAAGQNAMATWQHPDWWIAEIRATYPDDWESILAAGNQHPPMTLRVNQRRIAVAAYMDRLAADGIAARHLGNVAVRLDKPQPITGIPGFAEGLVSIQDYGAQRAAQYLSPLPGQRVLDACAAPGGKTAHILESVDCDLTAIDIDARRCHRIGANLQRLGLDAKILVGDATTIGAWWDGKMFDRILADAPCSASGIVRRRPDIKWHRRARDLPKYAQTQREILKALWQVLAPGGRLLYSTCSLFSLENLACIEAFIKSNRDARTVELAGLRHGQLLPSDDNDGFFYALLEKT